MKLTRLCKKHLKVNLFGVISYINVPDGTKTL